MSDPVVIDPIMQMDTADCGVACLAMILSAPYREVRIACPKKVGSEGLSYRQMQNVAKRLGHSLTYTKLYDEEDIGILGLQRPSSDGTEDHWVVYVKDTIYNPAQGQWWTDADAYLKESRYTVDGILKRRE